MYEQQLTALKKDFSAVAFTDAQTLEVMQQVYQKNNVYPDRYWYNAV